MQCMMRDVFGGVGGCQVSSRGHADAGPNFEVGPAGGKGHKEGQFFRRGGGGVVGQRVRKCRHTGSPLVPWTQAVRLPCPPADVFATFKDLLTRHKPLIAQFLADNYAEVGGTLPPPPPAPLLPPVLLPARLPSLPHHHHPHARTPCLPFPTCSPCAVL